MNNWYAFRKVLLMEDEDQNMHLKNLSIHAAQNEEEALNLLFLGDTNRMIAEVRISIKKNKTDKSLFFFAYFKTPMNQASTRSHCIFTIHVTSKEIGSVTVRKAKLHLVDLAGFVSFFILNSYENRTFLISVLNVFQKQMSTVYY